MITSNGLHEPYIFKLMNRIATNWALAVWFTIHKQEERLLPWQSWGWLLYSLKTISSISST